jgi:hypothetical protein
MHHAIRDQLAVQRARHFPRGVDAIFIEGLKAGQQDSLGSPVMATLSIGTSGS